MTTKKNRYFVMVNSYRSSTSNGFSNTWDILECEDQAHQKRILTEGLPVNDEWFLHADGTRTPCTSTMGIRKATVQEIRKAKNDEILYSCSIRSISELV